MGAAAPAPGPAALGSLGAAQGPHGSGAAFKHAPGAPGVLQSCSRAARGINTAECLSGAHDHRVFWKFAFGIPLYLGKRKPVFCVP